LLEFRCIGEIQALKKVAKLQLGVIWPTGEIAGREARDIGGQPTAGESNDIASGFNRTRAEKSA
jgi:hypothetical protein